MLTLDNHFANSVVDTVTGKSCKYCPLVSSNVHSHTKVDWETSLETELRRLAQGVGTQMGEGSNTVFFKPWHKIPKDRKVTYGRIVVSIRPQKKEIH